MRLCRCRPKPNPNQRKNPPPPASRKPAERKKRKEGPKRQSDGRRVEPEEFLVHNATTSLCCICRLPPAWAGRPAGLGDGAKVRCRVPPTNKNAISGKGDHRERKRGD